MLLRKIMLLALSIILILPGGAWAEKKKKGGKKKYTVHDVRRPLTKTSNKMVFAHFMVSYTTPEHGGKWKGWKLTNARVDHNPDRVKSDGRRDIAASAYPLVGPYDMTDPALVEYHCQLLKMSGIDGAIFDLGFYHDPNVSDEKQAKFAVNVMKLYARYFKKYGLKAMIMFEEKAHWLWNAQLTTREETVDSTLKDLDRWLALMDDVYFKVKNRKIVSFFKYTQEVPGRGEAALSPEELARWQNKFEAHQRPILLAQTYQDEFRHVLNGFFEWPILEPLPIRHLTNTHFNSLEKEMEIWMHRTHDAFANTQTQESAFVMGGVWPGFDDSGCGGWGAGNREIPREDGQVYDFHWQRILSSRYSIVQIATWNDWFEGTFIEPSEEYGFKYLVLTRKYIQQFKGQAIAKGDFGVPVWIYQTRKTTKDPEMLALADAASTALVAGKYARAEAMVHAYLVSTEFARR